MLPDTLQLDAASTEELERVWRWPLRRSELEDGIHEERLSWVWSGWRREGEALT